MPTGPSKYEAQAWTEIAKWERDVARGGGSRVPNPAEWLHTGLASATRWATSRRGVSGLVERLDGAAEAGLRVAASTVDRNAVLERYREAGFPALTELSEIHRLDLRQADQIAAGLRRKYTVASGLEGGLAGLAATVPAAGQLAAAGVVAADALGSLLLSQRALAHYCAVYGFDPRLPEEQVFLQGLLGLEGVLDSAGKDALLEELHSVAVMLASRASFEHLRTHSTRRMIERALHSLGGRLLERRATTIVPVIGAAAGAGVNVAFTAHTCTAGSMGYRKRFLLAKYPGLRSVPRAAGSLDPALLGAAV